MKPFATLQVVRSPGGIEYDLWLPGREVSGAMRYVPTHPIDEAELIELQALAAQLFRSGPSETFPLDAKATGERLYNALIPPELGERLRDLQVPLLVSVPRSGLPFELFYADDFWALRYALGKQIRLEVKGRSPEVTRTSGPMRALVISSDPRGDLAFVDHEAGKVTDTLVGGVRIKANPLYGPEANVDEVTRRLAERYDVIHFCGHIDRGSGGVAPGLLLASEQVLSGEVIRQRLDGRPFVFLNGCLGARGDTHKGWEEDISSVAYGFIRGGARAVIATVSEIGDEQAADLAVDFYRLACSGECLGEALRQARENARSKAPPSPAWLSFVLYGNPAEVLVDRSSESSTESSSVSPKVPAPADGERSEGPSAVTVTRESNYLAPSSASWGREWARSHRRGVLFGTFSFFAVVAIILLTLWRRGSRDESPNTETTVLALANVPRVPDAALGADSITVIEFGNLDEEDRGRHGWMGKAIQAALATELGKVEALDLYPEKLARIPAEGAPDLMLRAQKVGINKVVTGSFKVLGAKVRIDASVLDAATGKAIGEGVEGDLGEDDKEFFNLQKQLVLSLLRRMKTHVLPPEEGSIAAETNTSIVAYRLLLDGERVGAQSATASGQPSSVRRAEPLDLVSDEQTKLKVKQFLEDYRHVQEGKDLDGLTTLHVAFPYDQREAMRAYLANTDDLTIEIVDISIAINDETVWVSFTRRDRFIDKLSRAPERVEIRLAKTLTHSNGRLKISPRTPNSALIQNEAWENNGPEGGEVSAIAIDPSEPRTIYLGTGGGVFISTNGGERWRLSSDGLNGRVATLAIGPTVPQIIYAGGDRGSWKSTDAGESWTKMTVELFAYSLAIDPTDPRTAYWGGNGGMFKSTNGGDTWTRLGRGRTSSLVIAPTTPPALYAVRGGADTKLFKSTNGGENWYESGSGIWRPRTIAFDPDSPKVVYLGTGGHVFRSTDSGESWAPVASGMTDTNRDVTQIVVAPGNPGKVFIAREGGLFESIDSGDSWHRLKVLPRPVGNLVINPAAANELYAGTDGAGIFRSTDSGKNWTAINRNLVASTITSIVVDPSRPGTAYAGTNGGVFRTTDGGSSWKENDTILGWSSLAIDATGNAVYSLSDEGGSRAIYKATDDGQRWNKLKNQPSTTYPNDDLLGIYTDCHEANVLFANTRKNLFKSLNGGDEWRSITDGLDEWRRANGGVIDLTVEHLTGNASGVLYAATRFTKPSSTSTGTEPRFKFGNSPWFTPGQGLLKSINGGQSWNLANNGLPNMQIGVLAVDPRAGSNVFVSTTDNGLFKTTDAGQSWQDIRIGSSGDEPDVVTCIVIDPSFPWILYAGTGTGLYSTTSSGESWSKVENAMSLTFDYPVTALGIEPAPLSRLYVGTEGHGVFVLTLGPRSGP